MKRDYESEWIEVWGLIINLWPNWEANNVQRDAWKAALMPRPQEVLKDAVYTHFRESTFNTPRLARIMDAIKVAREASTNAGRSSSSGASREDYAKWQRDAWALHAQNIRKVADYSVGKVHEEVLRMQEDKTAGILAPSSYDPTAWTRNELTAFVIWMNYRESLQAKSTPFYDWVLAWNGRHVEPQPMHEQESVEKSLY